MIRGTTPSLEFKLPFSTDLLQTVWVTFAQRGKIIFEKELPGCQRHDNILSVKLTQEETLLMDCKYKLEIQIRVKLFDGDALVSKVIEESVDRILKDGVI